VVAAGVAALTLCSSQPSAYVLSGPGWGASVVPYYVNPANLDLPTASISPAVAAGADAWQQSGAAFRFTLAGQSDQTTTTYDQVNLVLFRNASNASAIATAYWWSSGSQIVDADIVFWDAAFLFFAGSTGCSGGFYIEDIAAHEFGHALGLGHSTTLGATMYPSASACTTSNRSLDADDVAGVRALYPPPAAPPLAPTGFRIVRSSGVR
jgi:Matrixin